MREALLALGYLARKRIVTDKEHVFHLPVIRIKQQRFFCCLC